MALAISRIRWTASIRQLLLTADMIFPADFNGVIAVDNTLDSDGVNLQRKFIECAGERLRLQYAVVDIDAGGLSFELTTGLKSLFQYSYLNSSLPPCSGRINIHPENDTISYELDFLNKLPAIVLSAVCMSILVFVLSSGSVIIRAVLLVCLVGSLVEIDRRISIMKFKSFLASIRREIE